MEIRIDIDLDEAQTIVREHLERTFGNKNWEIEYRSYTGFLATCKWPPEPVAPPAVPSAASMGLADPKEPANG